ncbi:MAG TPA: hypothetical protein VHD63_00900, partial [Ktedonobacteraceae bacterium]|nr:hypothetical protein [Ktedonobacteraceae bacterium]
MQRAVTLCRGTGVPAFPLFPRRRRRTFRMEFDSLPGQSGRPEQRTLKTFTIETPDLQSLQFSDLMVHSVPMSMDLCKWFYC